MIYSNVSDPEIPQWTPKVLQVLQHNSKSIGIRILKTQNAKSEILEQFLIHNNY